MARRAGWAIDLLQDEEEFRHWFLPKGAICPECGLPRGQGRPYQWIIDEYRRKYRDPFDSTKPLEISTGTISNWRVRLGLPRRNVSDESLTPWTVRPEHKKHHLVASLRNVARYRAQLRGELDRPMPESARRRAVSFERRLKESGVVVHYDPDTEEGFWPVAARPGIDKDLIREPGHIGRIRGTRS